MYLRFLPLFTIYSAPFALLSTSDYLLFSSCACLGIYNCLVFSACIITVSLVSRRSFKKQRQQLKQKTTAEIGVGEKITSTSLSSLVNLASSVATFRAGHTHLVQFLAIFNQTLSGKFFASFLVFNLAYNAYSFMFIVYNKEHSIGPLFRLAFSSYQIMHFGAPFSVATYVLKINRQIYDAQELISGLLAKINFQSSLRSVSLPLFREQWKLSSYLELFDKGESSKKTKTMAMTVAIFGFALERKTLFEFVLIYGAFLMHFGGFIVTSKKAEFTESVSKL